MKMGRAAVTVAVAGALVAPRMAAQVPAPGARPVFEVVSIKSNKSGDGRVGIGFQPGGRFTATGITLRMLIATAYGTPQPLPNFRIIGGPDWIGSDRFDVVAKAEGDVPPGPNGILPLMIRAMLADRFKLAVHDETRELPLFELVKARSDGRLGPQLKASSVDCAALAGARGRGAPPPDGRGAAPVFTPGSRPPCSVMMGPANLAASGQPISQLATILSGRVGRTVIDRTGLTGAFDFDLMWTPEQIPQGPAASPPPGAPPLPPIDPNGPSIFTAVQEQLGLKLESSKGPVDVVVIDRAEQPTED